MPVANETVPTSIAATSGRTGGRHRGARRPWYRRKLVMIPLVLLVALGALIGGAAVYINARFDTINALSTPPPVISGAQLGGDEDLIVDTGPAQEAVRRARQGDSPAASSDVDVPAGEDSDPTTALPATNGRALVVFGLQGDATPAGETDESASPVPSAEDSETIHLPPSDSGDAILVLLMGVDARPGEAIDVGVRSDTLVVLNLDPETGSCRLLAIPRDSRVELPGYGPSKINHALAVGGVPYQMLVVEDLLGITLDHYGLIDFAGVEVLVDTLGGITVNNERAFTFEGYEFPEGEIDLNGEEALAYVRFRGDEEGDFGRQERQQLVVRAMLAQGADLDVVTAIPDLLDAVEDHVRTDAGPTTLVDLGREFHSTCTADTLDAKRINGEVATLHDAIFDEPLSFVVLDEQEVTEKLNWLLTAEEPPTPTPAASPVASPAATPAATPVASPVSSPEATDEATPRGGV